MYGVLLVDESAPYQPSWYLLQWLGDADLPVGLECRQAGDSQVKTLRVCEDSLASLASTDHGKVGAMDAASYFNLFISFNEFVLVKVGQSTL